MLLGWDILRCWSMRSRQPSNDRLPATLRVTVIEAASILGITPDAVRSRLRRGTLHKETSEDGTVYVRLDTEGPAGLNDQTTDRSADQTTVVYINELKSEIDYLKETVAKRDEEIRRRDHLLAAALERIPAIEAPQEAPESPEGGDGAPDSTSPCRSSRSGHHAHRRGAGAGGVGSASERKQIKWTTSIVGRAVQQGSVDRK
jgi:hypothetical protein